VKQFTADFDLPIPARFELGEGPIWHEGTLYWVDIEGMKVCMLAAGWQEHREIDVGERAGTVVPRRSGGLVVALQHGFAFLDPATGALTRISDPEAHLPGNRFNDGKCDSAGRFWAGTMSLKEDRGAGSLYALEPGGRVRKALGGVTISNGIAWSFDTRTMFYIDTPTGGIDQFDFDLGTGEISNRRRCIEMPRGIGHPDGMTMDAEENLWIGLWDGGAVARVSPATGAILALYRFPVSHVTACAFGGSKLEELYVTTARKDGEAQSGSLFRFKPGVTGLEACTYAG
jgi:sugar lactone lactonase YvrE